ncbi:hypothetical protein GHT06_022673 [Daphnia sinensis]|uniref:Uncharacterized protein n=1 Tax=Daphnia sinensis TaxID=1820382 RepID=A0AAD5KHX3_9CRUS|nr:hypothetical protein GHT06_022673 [Daphnia sinensis]
MTLVDKRRLSEALKLTDKKISAFDFAWGHYLEESVLLSLCVTGVGNITVPISLTDIERLKKAKELEHHVAGNVDSLTDTKTMQIDAQSVVFTPSNFLQSGISALSSTAMRHLGINPGVLAMETHLDKLSFTPPGGRLEPSFVLKRQPGMFATMILQIPVEGGHTGGTLKVQSGSKSMGFKCVVSNNQKFHLTAIYVGCKQELETVTAGWMVTLSFNLVWKNAIAMADSPLPLPALITVLNEITESLKAWTTPTDYEPIRQKVVAPVGASPEEIVASVLDTFLPSDRLDYSPAILSPNARCSNEASNMLFFLLEGKYSIADLGFADLTGQDEKLARIFNCSLFLDTHLAVITQHITGALDYSDLEKEMLLNKTFKIEHWINSTNTLIKLKGIEFDLRTQLIGDMQKLKNYIVHEDGESEKKLPPGSPRSFFCHYPVLVIWPKPQTIRIYCQHGFDAVLDRMEAAVDISSNCQELIGDLGIVLSFCRTEPCKVWRDPTIKAGHRTYRLLRLCLFLQARDEGLELLDLLATDFCSASGKDVLSLITNSNSPTYVYEGIQSEEVAEVIAEFQYLISGWSACLDRILKLATPNRIVEQLVQLINLVKHLLDRSCLEEGANLMDCISLILRDLESNFAKALGQPEVDAFMDQLTIMETNPMISNPSRLEDFTSLFPRLDFNVQCRLVVDLQKDKCARLRTLPSCQQMFRNLCHSVSVCDLRATGLKPNVVVQLLTGYLKLDDEILVRSITDQICTTNIQCQEPSVQNNDLLEEILSSSDVWELVPTLQLAKETVVRLVTARLSFLVSVVDQPVPVAADDKNAPKCEDVQNPSKMQPSRDAVRKSVSRCVHWVFRLERDNVIEDQQGIDLLTSLYSKLSLENLCHLTLDLRVLNGPLLKENPTSCRLFVNLCQLLVNRCKEALPQVPQEIVIEVVKTFFWLGDVLLVRSLVKQICLAGSGGSWDPVDKNKLLETIVSSLESWCETGPSSSRLVRDSSTALIGAWIVGLCRILDQVGSTATLSRQADGLRNKIAICVNIFIRTEKSQPRTDQPSIATFFSLLLSKLSPERLCHLIIDLRKLEVTNSSSSLLKSPPCFDVYRDLCRLLVSQDLKSFMKSYAWLVTEVWKCFHWFADEEIFMKLSHKILDAFLPDQENPLVARIVGSSELRLLATASSYGKTAFCLFLDQRISHLKSISKPYLSWDHPYAVVPGHPEVEAFLRSSQKSMMYSHFGTFSAACKFAVRVSGTKNGYSVQVNPVKVSKQFRCKIDKMLSRNALLKKEIDDLAEFLRSLKQADDIEAGPSPKSSNSPAEKITFKKEIVSSDDEVCVTRPTKRAKGESSFIANAVDY